MPGTNKWEEIDSHTERLKVPGGWIVRSSQVHYSMGGNSCCVHQIFIADPQHEWVLTKE